MNITPEPRAWFDLVTACGLDDVRAVSIHDLISALPVDERPAGPLPSVTDVAEALIPRFADIFQREFLPLSAPAPADEPLAQEIAKIQEIVADVEEQAERALKEAGGKWPTKPSVQ
jgi:lipoyl(octanoyl) transferase